MRSENQFVAKWKHFCEAARPILNKIGKELSAAMDGVVAVCSFIAKFKKLFLGVPILTVALIMAFVNLFSLPALVGFMLQGDGSFAFEIVREVAVLVPLLITLVCLLLLFISKRTMTPWMVSLCSLLLPLLLYFTNVFPA